MELYLHMARQAAASHLLCRVLLILLHREELFPGKLYFLFICSIVTMLAKHRERCFIGLLWFEEKCLCMCRM